MFTGTVRASWEGTAHYRGQVTGISKSLHSNSSHEKKTVHWRQTLHQWVEVTSAKMSPNIKKIFIWIMVTNNEFFRFHWVLRPELFFKRLVVYPLVMVWKVLPPSRGKLHRMRCLFQIWSFMILLIFSIFVRCGCSVINLILHLDLTPSIGVTY